MDEQKTISGGIPDIEGTFGQAWRCNMTEIHMRLKISADQDATVCAWIVDAPWAHPLWRSYLIAAIHLRPTKALPHPKISLSGATHEVFVYALDPGREPNLLSPASTRLEPANFAGQWIAASDIEAEEKIEACVREIICGGTLSPDTDFTRSWVQRFSDSNLQ